MPLAAQTVHGRLVDNAGLPISTAVLRIYQHGVQKAVVVTSTQGYWKLDLEPGKYVAECIREDEVTTQTFLVGVEPTRKFTSQDYREIKEKC